MDNKTVVEGNICRRQHIAMLYRNDSDFSDFHLIQDARALVENGRSYISERQQQTARRESRRPPCQQHSFARSILSKGSQKQGRNEIAAITTDSRYLSNPFLSTPPPGNADCVLVRYRRDNQPTLTGRSRHLFPAPGTGARLFHASRNSPRNRRSAQAHGIHMNGMACVI